MTEHRQLPKEFYVRTTTSGVLAPESGVMSIRHM